MTYNDDEFKEYVTGQLSSISGMIGGLDKKLDLHIQSTVYELKAINRLDEQQNKLIDQHIEGVKTLKTLIDQNEENADQRFHKLEEPRKLWGLFVKIMVGVGGSAGGIAGAMAIFEYLKKALIK